jgi:hypothetical protein
MVKFLPEKRLNLNSLPLVDLNDSISPLIQSIMQYYSGIANKAISQLLLPPADINIQASCFQVGILHFAAATLKVGQTTALFEQTLVSPLDYPETNTLDRLFST